MNIALGALGEEIICISTQVQFISLLRIPGMPFALLVFKS